MEGASSSSTQPQTPRKTPVGVGTPDLLPETLAAFGGDELQARVFHDKYALRDPDGGVLERTPDQMWRRIARELASVEAPGAGMSGRPTSAGCSRTSASFPAAGSCTLRVTPAASRP